MSDSVNYLVLYIIFTIIWIIAACGMITMCPFLVFITDSGTVRALGIFYGALTVFITTLISFIVSILFMWMVYDSIESETTEDKIIVMLLPIIVFIASIPVGFIVRVLYVCCNSCKNISNEETVPIVGADNV